MKNIHKYILPIIMVVLLCAYAAWKLNDVEVPVAPTTIGVERSFVWINSDSLETCIVKTYLSDMVINNADIVDELANKAEKKKPVSERQKDYFEDRKEAESSTSGWISGLRFFAWFSLIAIIIIGLILGVPFFGYETGIGFAIILSSIIIGFLSVAGIMVFIDMAEDVKYIRNHILRKKF